jgi:hypothetical protein
VAQQGEVLVEGDEAGGGPAAGGLAEPDAGAGADVEELAGLGDGSEEVTAQEAAQGIVLQFEAVLLLLRAGQEVEISRVGGGRAAGVGGGRGGAQEAGEPAPDHGRTSCCGDGQGRDGSGWTGAR